MNSLMIQRNKFSVLKKQVYITNFRKKWLRQIEIHENENPLLLIVVSSSLSVGVLPTSGN